GLVVRYMIKHNYTDLVEAGYRLDDVALIATPNHGTWLVEDPIFLPLLLFIIGALSHKIFIIAGIAFLVIYRILVTVYGGFQAEQMKVLKNSFLYNLNTLDETPYGIDDNDTLYQHISWSTFSGNKGMWVDYRFSSWGFLFINPLVYLEGGEDGLVHVSSVPLEGAHNHGPYSRNHEELLYINTLREDNYFENLYVELTT
ncbi:MAG: hypothetical protein ACTSRS_07720, partial [Candidatus Helarchaeota archaeon]